MKTAARMLNSSGASLWHIDGLDESHDDETDESGDCQLVTKNVRVTKEEIVFQKQFSEVNSARSNRNFEKHTRARKEQTCWVRAIAARGMYESLCLFFFIHIYHDLQCNYLSLKLTDINSRKRWW